MTSSLCQWSWLTYDMITVTCGQHKHQITYLSKIKWITCKLCIILPFSCPVELKVKITHVHKGFTSWVCQHHHVHDSWYTEIPMSMIESHINHCMVSQDRPLLMYCERCNVLRQPCVAEMTFKWFFLNCCKLQPVCCFGDSDTDTSDRGSPKAQSQDLPSL